jgi:hypothetical protein
MGDLYEELPPLGENRAGDDEDQPAGVPRRASLGVGSGGSGGDIGAGYPNEMREGFEGEGGRGEGVEGKGEYELGVTISKEMILKGVSKADSRRGLNEVGRYKLNPVDT